MEQPSLPAAIFWDIENCAIPRGLTGHQVSRAVLTLVPKGYRVLQFAKLSRPVRLSLAHGTVDVIDVPSRRRWPLIELSRFSDQHKPPAVIVLISGDVDYVQRLSDLQRSGYTILLLHNEQAHEALKKTATRSPLPWRSFLQQQAREEGAADQAPTPLYGSSPPPCQST